MIHRFESLGDERYSAVQISPDHDFALMRHAIRLVRYIYEKVPYRYCCCQCSVVAGWACRLLARNDAEMFALWTERHNRINDVPFGAGSAGLGQVYQLAQREVLYRYHKHGTLNVYEFQQVFR